MKSEPEPERDGEGWISSCRQTEPELATQERTEPPVKREQVGSADERPGYRGSCLERQRLVEMSWRRSDDVRRG